MKTMLITATYGPLLGHTIIHHTVEAGEPLILDHIPPAALKKFVLLVSYENHGDFSASDFPPDLKAMVESDWPWFMNPTGFIMVHRIRAKDWVGVPFMDILLRIEDEEDINALMSVVPSIQNQRITLDPQSNELLRACADKLQGGWFIRMKPLFIKDLTPNQETQDGTDIESDITYRSEGPRRGRASKI